MKQINILALLFIITIIVACISKVNTSEMSVTGSDGAVYSSYQSACSKGDFDAARDYIAKLKEKNVVVQAEGDYKEREAFENLIQEAESYVANEEIQYLASLNEEQANNRIILIINQRPVEGFEVAEMTCLGKDVYNSYIDNWDGVDAVDDFKKYITWCGNHNTTCSNVLNIAIACGNQSLAKKILHCFRKDPQFLRKEVKGHEDHFDVYAHYTSASKDSANKKYDDAVRSGAFNE